MNRAAAAVFGGIAACLGYAEAADSVAPLSKAYEIRNSDAPLALVTGDWNEDRLPDFAVTNYFDNSVQIALGLGNGNFVPTAGKIPVGAYPSQIVVGDWNRDSRPDLAVTNADEASVSIVLGEPQGAFTQARKVALASSPDGLVVGDWNGDGYADIAVAHRGVATVTLMISTGRGDFRTAAAIAVGGSGRIASGDWNGDGWKDLVTGGSDPDRLILLRNNHGTGFAEVCSFAAEAAITALAVADLDSDGLDDILASTADGYIHIHTHLTNDSCVPDRAIKAGGYVSAITTADLDRDGHTDVAYLVRDRNEMVIARGSGRGLFPRSVTLAADSSPTSIAVADLNRDGCPDLVIANHGGKALTSFLNGGSDGGWPE